jgi:hypothetical protein
MENLILYQSPVPKFRVGKPHDGGYVISNLPGQYDLFISGGISDDISFEEHFLSLYPDLTCYAFDGTIQTFPRTDNKKLIFIPKNLGSTNTETLTNMHDYMRIFNNIFMKIDIEGHEFRVMPTLVENNYIQKIKQLVIEIHSPGDIQLYPDYFKGLADIKNEHMFGLLNNLNKTHTLVHFHANNGCRIQTIEGIQLPHVFELTYIRNDFVTGEKIRNTEPLPTPLDMRNCISQPDYTLTGYPYTQ